jgi:hypothetical protein
MSVIKKISAWVGFTYDLAKILFRREHVEPTTNEPAEDESSIEPVVLVPPDASRMIAHPPRASTPQEPAPLEGSINDRRQRMNSR